MKKSSSRLLSVASLSVLAVACSSTSSGNLFAEGDGGSTSNAGRDGGAQRGEEDDDDSGEGGSGRRDGGGRDGGSGGSDGGKSDGGKSDGGGGDGGGGDGDDGGGGDGGGACVLAIEFEDLTCNTCMQAHCCSFVNACAEDTACIAIDDCINDCFENASDEKFDECIDACFDAAPPASGDKWDAASVCLEQTCLTACPF